MSADPTRAGVVMRDLTEKLVSLGARGLLLNVIAIATIGLVGLGHSGFGAALAAVGLLTSLHFTQTLLPWSQSTRQGIARRTPASPLGSYSLSRAVLAIALGLHAIGEGLSVEVSWLPALAFALVIVAEPVVAAVTRVPELSIANASWLSPSSRPPFNTTVIFLINTLGLLFTTVAVAVGASPLYGLMFPSISAGLVVAAGLAARKRVQANRRAKSTLTAELTKYAPRFVLYWEAEEGTTYQVAMWLPYLEQLGEKYVVILRSRRNMPVVAPLTDAPVILCESMAELDDVIVPSLRTAFYVNNSIRNCHFVRYPQLTHIQLNHGDSDKAPSFNPVMRMYDKNFVAGQAAIDRFAANGIEVRNDFFAIVGRPQVSEVLVRNVTSRGPGRKTVLYAPTWAGFTADSNHSSLPIGPALVAALLKRDVNVIFRPHPHSRKLAAYAEACDRIEAMLASDQAATGRQHVYGASAEVEMSIFGCFNMSDAMVSDVSSVVPDYLYSEKPLALIAMNSTYDEIGRAHV